VYGSDVFVGEVPVFRQLLPVVASQLFRGQPPHQLSEERLGLLAELRLCRQSTELNVRDLIVPRRIVKDLIVSRGIVGGSCAVTRHA